MHFSNLLHYSRQSLISIESSVSFSNGKVLAALMLEAVHHTIRHCCPLLQYEGYLMVSCYSESPLDAEIFMVHAFNWWPVLLDIICPNCPIAFHICKTYDILHLESIRHIPVDCKREMPSFIQHCPLLRLYHISGR